MRKGVRIKIQNFPARSGLFIGAAGFAVLLPVSGREIQFYQGCQLQVRAENFVRDLFYHRVGVVAVRDRLANPNHLLECRCLSARLMVDACNLQSSWIRYDGFVRRRRIRESAFSPMGVDIRAGRRRRNVVQHDRSCGISLFYTTIKSMQARVN